MSGESQMAIIHFLMEFRLRPLAGSGEDWVSLVIPYNSATRTQSYLLRGLTPGVIFVKFNLEDISTLSFIPSSGTLSIEEKVFPRFCFQFRVFVCLDLNSVSSLSPWLYISMSHHRDVIRGQAEDQDSSRRVSLLIHLGVLYLGSLDHAEARDGVPAQDPGGVQRQPETQHYQGPLGRLL